MQRSDADRLLRFARLAARPAAQAVRGTSHEGDSVRQHADRLVGHWRKEGAVLSAIPSAGGALTSELGDVVAATFQGLLVVSLCDLADESDLHRRVELLSTLVFKSKLPAGWTVPATEDSDEPSAAASTSEAAESPVWRRMLKSAPAGVISLLREVRAIKALSERRSAGKIRHRVIKKVPVVGMVGAAFGERSALSDLAEAAYATLGL